MDTPQNTRQWVSAKRDTNWQVEQFMAISSTGRHEPAPDLPTSWSQNRWSDNLDVNDVFLNNDGSWLPNNETNHQDYANCQRREQQMLPGTQSNVQLNLHRSQQSYQSFYPPAAVDLNKSSIYSAPFLDSLESASNSLVSGSLSSQAYSNISNLSNPRSQLYGYQPESTERAVYTRSTQHQTCSNVYPFYNPNLPPPELFPAMSSSFHPRPAPLPTTLPLTTALNPPASDSLPSYSLSNASEGSDLQARQQPSQLLTSTFKIVQNANTGRDNSSAIQVNKRSLCKRRSTRSIPSSTSSYSSSDTCSSTVRLLHHRPRGYSERAKRGFSPNRVKKGWNSSYLSREGSVYNNRRERLVREEVDEQGSCKDSGRGSTPRLSSFADSHDYEDRVINRSIDKIWGQGRNNWKAKDSKYYCRHSVNRSKSITRSRSRTRSRTRVTEQIHHSIKSDDNSTRGLSKMQQVGCRVCRIPISGSVEMHLLEKAHKQKQRMMLRGCKLCNIRFFHSYPVFVEHMEGSDHRDKLLQLKQENGARNHWKSNFSVTNSSVDADDRDLRAGQHSSQNLHSPHSRINKTPPASVGSSTARSYAMKPQTTSRSDSCGGESLIEEVIDVDKICDKPRSAEHQRNRMRTDSSNGIHNSSYHSNYDIKTNDMNHGHNHYIPQSNMTNRTHCDNADTFINSATLGMTKNQQHISETCCKTGPVCDPKHRTCTNGSPGNIREKSLYSIEDSETDDNSTVLCDSTAPLNGDPAAVSCDTTTDRPSSITRRCGADISPDVGAAVGEMETEQLTLNETLNERSFSTSTETISVNGSNCVRNCGTTTTATEIGQQIIFPISGFFCRLCSTIINGDVDIMNKHCLSHKHLANMEKLKRNETTLRKCAIIKDKNSGNSEVAIFL